MIIITAFTCIVYGCLVYNKEIVDGKVKHDVPWLGQYTAAIGFSAYAFEGIGLILPV